MLPEPFLVRLDAWWPEADVGLPVHGCGNLHKDVCVVAATCTEPSSPRGGRIREKIRGGGAAP
jgi:hypothetical protein